MATLIPLALFAGAARAAEAGGDEMLSAAFTREALALLAEGGPEAAAQGSEAAPLEAAAVLLDLSAGLTPEASEMQWLRADLAERRGDVGTLRDALGAYLRERPEDDAALLKAALVRVTEAQTLDGRLTRMKEILASSARGGEATAAMRSRLSLLASEAAAELGNASERISLLGQAAALDPANAAAAAGVFDLLAARDAGAKRLGAAAANWVFAAPVDAVPRLALARVLAGEGAHAVAADQYERASVFSGATLLPLPDLRRYATALLATGREREAREMLSAAEARLAAGEPGTDAGERRLIDLFLVVLAEPGAEAAALERLHERAGALVDRGGPEEREEARLDRAWIDAVLAVRPVEEAEAALELAGGRYADADPRREVAAGWIALRRGDPAAARAAFSSVPEHPLARLGLAELADPGDPTRDALLDELAAAGSGDPAGLLAVRKLEEEKREVPVTPVGQAVLNLMAERPASLWRMEVTREPLIALRCEVQPRRILPFRRAELVVTLENRSRLPVSLGDGQTLRPVAFVSTALFEGETPLGALPTQVVNVGRRLSLEPGEALSVPTRLDHGPIGRRLAQEPDRDFSFSMSVTLDPRLTPSGAVAIGPLGAVETLRGVQAAGSPVSEAAIRGWFDAMSGDSTLEEYAALVRLAMLQGGTDDRSISPRLLADTTSLLGERVPNLATTPLALCGLYLQSGARRDPAIERILATARSSRDDAVRVATLLGQVRDPTDPALDAAVRAGSPRLRRFAEAWTRVLMDRDPVAAGTTPR
ncbi:hypothetical protein [Phycisphaera mikurensis]|uniref:hypothetical protein n=1 Tax=Phycisphaera mikurensis TaxID=547188 RepID=UPI00059BEF9A|nr:hypothetical protein [Phycisphaera mikurensis]MBB6441537.1 hypothetical protein [Phycisphaera mikurensis]